MDQNLKERVVMVRVLLLSICLFIAAFAQKPVGTTSNLIKGIIYSENSIIFETINGLRKVEKASINYLDQTEEEASQDFNILDFPFSLVKIEDANYGVENINKVSFQQHHKQELFFRRGENKFYYLTNSAKAIIGLLVFNDFSTSDSHYFTFLEKTD